MVIIMKSNWSRNTDAIFEFTEQSPTGTGGKLITPLVITEIDCTVDPK